MSLLNRTATTQSSKPLLCASQFKCSLVNENISESRWHTRSSLVPPATRAYLVKRPTPESKPTQSAPAPPLCHWPPPKDWFADCRLLQNFHVDNQHQSLLLSLIDFHNHDPRIGCLVKCNDKKGEDERTSGGKVTLDQVSLGIAQSHAPLSIPMLLIPRANLIKISWTLSFKSS